MAWVLKLDREREWPANSFVGELAFRDPNLRDLRDLPAVEKVDYRPDGSWSYLTSWQAVEVWLVALVKAEEHRGLIGQLSPAEATRAKDALLGFFGLAAVETPSKTPPTTSDSEQPSPAMRID